MDEVLTTKRFEIKRRHEKRNKNAWKKCHEQNKLNWKLSRSKLPLFPLATLEDVDELEELLEDAEQRRILLSIVNGKAKLYIQNVLHD